MLDAPLKVQLSDYLTRLRHPVELVASLDDSTTSQEIEALIEEIAALSPLLSCRKDGAFSRRPSFAIGQPGQAGRIHFAGVPLGHEFTSLILALLQTGGHPPKVDAATQEQIRRLPGSSAAPRRFETFISLSCHNCPDVVQAVNLIALLNPAFESVMVDGGVFQSEVAARGIMAVPALFLDDAEFGHGRMALEDVLARLDEAGAATQAAALSERAPYDVLVVGGGPAGAAAAIYAARKGIRTGLVAERFGGQVLDTLDIENLVSVPHTQGPQLAAALEQHVNVYEVDIIKQQRVQALSPGDGLHTLHLTSGATLQTRALILAPGARWRELGVPGEQEYKAKGVCFCPHCDGPLFKGKRVAVIGGGNSGVEAAIDLAGIVGEVTLLEFDSRLRADAVLQARLTSLPNVRVLCSVQTTEVLGDGQKVTGLRLKDRESGEETQLALEGLFVQIGLLPNTTWLKETLTLNRHGEIEVDARGQTSVPGVFAAGDATNVPFKQIIIAMGDGAKASLSAFDYLIRSAPSGEAATKKNASTALA